MQPALENGQTGPMGRVEGLPQVFGRYLLVQRLSRGGMGEIFLAKHGLAGFEKLAVIKKVLPHLAADAQFISRFVDEAQVAIKLQHVNIAQVFEVGRVGDEYFLGLEYVEGRDLRRTLALLGQRKSRLPVDLALFVGREVANGLAYAHRRTSNDGASLNLVHCDISPPNVLVSFEGETKVIDFGIAKSAIRGTATDPKMGFGKFGYMAPEQLIRGGIVDHRTDIYAAGVVLFELLTGKRLYEAGPEPDYRALAKKVAKGEHMLPSDVDKVLAPYDDLVATALRPKSEDRYQSAAEFRDSIQQCLVSVNPTISTDQLGSYMRDLFTEEMTAQRELHERVAKAHLEDFHDQLTTQTGTTVSFAFANMPLPAPPDAHVVPAPPVLPRTLTPQPPGKPRAPTAPTDMLPQQPAQPPPTPTAAIPTQEIDLADGTGAAELFPDSYVESIRPNHKRVVGLAIGAAALVIGVVVFAMTRIGHESAAAAVAKADPPKQHVTVEALPPERPDKAHEPIVTAIGSADAKTDVAPVKTDVTTTTNPDTTATTAPKTNAKTVAKTEAKTETPRTNHQTHVQQTHKQTHKQTEIVATKVTLTRDAVASKFSAVKREYDGYKSKNGGRLDGDWGDLAMFVQYHLNDSTLDEVAHRIDAFRSKLKE
ncbi:MAG: serine/threonine-protein kinase [Deltaproteobacteria bacterium]